MSRFGLVAFAKARIDEDEVWALASCAAERKPDWRPDHRDVFTASGKRIATASSANVAVQVARQDPARTLREVEAKRARLALLDEAVTEMDRLLADDDAAKIDQGVAIGRKEAALTAVKHDAAVYSDNPDYRDEWKP